MAEASLSNNPVLHDKTAVEANSINNRYMAMRFIEVANLAQIQITPKVIAL
jgi:hypothetical protein